MRIIQRLEMYSGSSVSPCCLMSDDNPTIQHLDTSIIAMLKGVDECGQVNHFTYSEDTPVKLYDDGIDAVSETQHELSYYQGISNNVAENAAAAAEIASSSDSNSVSSSEISTSETS